MRRTLLGPPMRMTVVAMIVAAGVGAALTDNWPAAADSPGASFTIDLDPSLPGHQATRTVPLGTMFSIDVVLDEVGDPPGSWIFYGASLTYDDVRIDAPSAGLPTNWTDAPVLNSKGGNLAPPFPGGTVCVPAEPANSITGEDDTGTANVLMGCYDGDAADVTTYAGALVELVLTCEIEGAAALSLSGIDETNIQDSAFISYQDHVHNATVICGTGSDFDVDGLPDSYENSHGCLNWQIPDATGDPDIDNLPSYNEYLIGTLPCDTDTDNDGCADGEEWLGSNPSTGGLRNPLSPWDFYDVDTTKKVDSIDIALVRSKFNQDFPPYDRSQGTAPWRPGPPDGIVNGIDVGLVRASFTHSCQAPPN